MGYLKKLPIKVQMSILAIMVIFIVLFIIISSYMKVVDMVEKKNGEYSIEMISQINQTIASNNDVLKRLVQNISYNTPIVQSYLNETNPTQQFMKYMQLKSYITDMISMKDGILDIALIRDEGTSFNTNGDLNNLIPFKDEIPKKQLYHLTGLKTLPFTNGERNVFIVGTKIYSILDFNDNEKELGTLMIVIDANALLGSPINTGRPNGSKMYMIDREGVVFFTNDDTMKVGSVYKEAEAGTADGQYIVQAGKIPIVDGEIVFKMPQQELLSGIDDIRQQQFTILFISLLLLAIPFLFVVNNILMPLKKLMRLMNTIKMGKLKKRIHLQGYAEIITVAKDFNDMMGEIDELTHRLLESNSRLYEAELVKKQAEMAYLQSQINPHFLYNTLESIKGIAAEEKVDRIFNMTKALARIFRYSIKGTDIVMLSQELTVIESYIYIQKIRFGKRLNVIYQFSSEILSCRVPRMILQPLVENAIFHGIEPKVGEGLLQLVGKIDGQQLYLSVSDNGIGIDEERLQEIADRMSGLQGISGKSTQTIGLANVNNRIKLSYGDEYGITIKSQSGVGTEVVIKIPHGGDRDV
ncbi:sensor histidine kinase [Paenibacillus sp. Soil787]|uniref:sensor histidine kinase n=1 Tax=Paenibacillus sp. Soil787 TaxID=1736411 RepID=UPI0006FCE01B|nr:histidine kinase [Paenibacillus sp. Soil787]KRF42270.1 hypothetical protein ASG93_21490 [Paenibacillus sp. Soil787]